MKIGIIGAGKVGNALAVGLAGQKFSIIGICSRTDSSASLLTRKLGLCFENSLVQVVSKADTIFITASDDALGKISSDIAAQVDTQFIRDKVFLHCSGACTSHILSSISEKGGFIGSLHPIQTFADMKDGWKGLYNIYYGFEGCNEAEKTAKAIVESFNSQMLVIDSEAKPLYHAAACVLSNYTVALSYIAGGLLEVAGLDADTGVKALAPLVSKTVKNIERFGAEKALTGPISRGDSGVVGQHLAAMEKKCPEFIEIYRILGKTALDIAMKNGSVSAEDIEKLYELLKPNRS